MGRAGAPAGPSALHRGPGQRARTQGRESCTAVARRPVMPDQIHVVTGFTSGIGKVTAARLAATGRADRARPRPGRGAATLGPSAHASATWRVEPGSSLED